MRKILLFVVSIPILLMSCGSDATPIPITFVFDKAIPEGKYPDYFEKITEPFTAIDCSIDYLLKPINVARLDIKKAPIEINAWYFEQMGDNTIDFSKIWLTQYFKDSLVNPHLTLPSKREVSESTLDSYLNKKDVFTIIYSEDSDRESYNETPIFSNPKDVSSKIRQNICGSNFKEIIVLVNPKKLSAIVTVPKTQAGGLNSTTTLPCNQQTTSKAFSLKEEILQVINIQNSYKKRDQLAREIWKKYFDEMATITMYNRASQIHPSYWESGDGANYFIDRLAYKNSIIDINVPRLEFHNKTGKITSMEIVECHNSSQIQ